MLVVTWHAHTRCSCVCHCIIVPSVFGNLSMCAHALKKIKRYLPRLASTFYCAFPKCYIYNTGCDSAWRTELSELLHLDLAVRRGCEAGGRTGSRWGGQASRGTHWTLTKLTKQNKTTKQQQNNKKQNLRLRLF